MRYLVILCCCIVTSVSAQLTAANKAVIDHLQDSLGHYSKQMIFNEIPQQRFKADTIFIKMLVQALKVPYSFYYNFDSVKNISKLTAPDSLFRIFTWQLEKDESYFRQEGVIQMNTKDGSLQLFPLFDASDFSSRPTDSARSNRNWIGALYYNILENKYNGKNYYTLLGYDDNDITSTRKWIEVLTFNAGGAPVFGGRYFDYENDELKVPQPVDRFVFEYKKDARARLNYDPELKMIVFDHLISESNEPQKRFSLIPDGDYEGFKWEHGKWVHVNKVFNQQLQDGEAPRPMPLENSSKLPTDDNN